MLKYFRDATNRGGDNWKSRGHGLNIDHPEWFVPYRGATKNCGAPKLLCQVVA